MHSSRKLLVVCFVGSLVAATSLSAQKEVTDLKAIVGAKTVFFVDQSGVDAVGKKALEELKRWGRFQIVQDQEQADLIVVLSRDPGQGGNLLLSGQTGSIDSQGHVAEDPIPNYTKRAPVHYAFLTVIERRNGKTLWSDSQRWGGLLTGFDGVGERLVKEFEKESQAAERRAGLKVTKKVAPTFPPGALKKQIKGTVDVKIVVDKNGRVSSAKAESGPGELLRSAEEAAKQYEFEAPKNAPVTAEVEMRYGYWPKPFPPGKNGDEANVLYAERLPMKMEKPGFLKVIGDIDVRMPRYPEEARKAGIEGDLGLIIVVAQNGEVIGARVDMPVDPAIDEAALATVRTWKFKVTRGEAGTFPIAILYRISCGSFTEK